MKRLSLFVSVTCIGLIALCFAFLIATRINLVIVDLGRHIENGKVLLEGTQVKNILTTNFYSYTNPTFPFINHHWGIGPIFYFVWKLAGFNGLSLFYIALALCMFGISFWLAVKKSSLGAASLVALIVMPLLASRREVRPEVITYIFALVCYSITWLVIEEKKIARGWLWMLLVVEVLWVNLHIGFFLGPCIVGTFLVSEIIQKSKRWNNIKLLWYVILGMFVTTLINPNGIKGALYPFFIFKNYGYTLYENVSVFKLEQLGFYSFEFAVFKVALVFTLLLVVAYVFVKKQWRFLLNPLVIITVAMAILGLQAVRNIILFAVFALPLAAYCLHRLLPNIKTQRVNVVISTVAVLVLGIATIQTVQARGENEGLGVYPGNICSLEFYKNNHLSGTIFNDYDIGSYLDFGLDKAQSVFVDNRPEAYPAAFFNTYIKAQEDADAWHALDNQYHFGIIWFNRNDLTPWAQQFLSTRAKDPEWVLVYLDNFTVIFVRNTEQNKALIEKYEIKSD